MTRNSKAFTTHLFEENGKMLSFVSYITYNDELNSISVYNNFKYDLSSALLGSARRNEVKRVSDDEMRKEVTKLIKENPVIRVSQIMEKRGYNKNRLYRIYMSIKRNNK